MYWLNTTSAILRSIVEDTALGIDKTADPSVAGVKALKLVKKLSGFDNLFGFVHNLQKLTVELYEEILFQYSKEVDPLVTSVFLIRTPGSPAAKPPKSPKPGTGGDLAPDIKALKAFFESLIDGLLENKIYPVLAGDLLVQIVEYIDETAFNSILKQKRLYSADGVRLKIGCLQLEHWIKDSRAASWLTKRNFSILKYVQEVSNLIMVEKEKLESAEFIRITFPNLNLRQVCHILDIFVIEENAKKPVPSSVMKFVSGLLKKSESSDGLILQGALNSHSTS